MLRRVGLQQLDHVADLGDRDAFDPFVAPGGRDVMIGMGEYLPRPGYPAPARVKLSERVRRPLVYIGAVDVEQHLALFLRDDVTAPDLVEHGPGCHLTSP
jgi:hypothetical protein